MNLSHGPCSSIIGCYNGQNWAILDRAAYCEERGGGGGVVVGSTKSAERWCLAQCLVMLGPDKHIASIIETRGHNPTDCAESLATMMASVGFDMHIYAARTPTSFFCPG